MRHKMTSRKKSRIALVICAILLLVSLSAYAERGWLRASAIPAYVNLFYKAQLDKTYSEVFNPVNQKLETYGFISNKLFDDECRKGDNVSFEGFTETVPCIKLQDNNLVGFSDAFIARWKSESPDLEQYLQSNGWIKQYNHKQPIAEIFNNPNNDSSIGVVYSKKEGKIYCNLSIIYNAWDKSPNKVFAQETCVRYFSLFGGVN